VCFPMMGAPFWRNTAYGVFHQAEKLGLKLLFNDAGGYKFLEKQIKQVEDLVNEKIMENIPVDTKTTTYKEATDQGVIAFFGDKYNPEDVRIVEVPGFSAELCGGTHVASTGDIGPFKITEMTALSAGHRRIFAVTGPEAVKLFQDSFNTVKKLSQEFKVQKEDVLGMVEKQKEQLKKLQSKIKQLKKESLKSNLATWATSTKEINSIPFLFLQLEDYANDQMREIVATLSDKTPGFYFLISSINGKNLFLATVSKEFMKQIDLKKFAAFLKEKHNLRGGGSATTIQGGAPTIDKKLQESIIAWLKDN